MALPFDAIAPYFEIIVTIVGLASAFYPTARWIVQQSNKRQERFEITIKNEMGQSSRDIKNVLETAKDDIEEVKESQDSLHDDVIRVDGKIGKIDEKLDKHIVWSTGNSSKLEAQVENNTKSIERVDSRVDRIYTGLTKRHEEQDSEIEENRDRVNEIADKLKMRKSVKLELNKLDMDNLSPDDAEEDVINPFKKKNPDTGEEINEDKE